MIKLGVLNKMDSRFDLAVNVRMTAVLFENSPHCAGHKPAEVHLNPADVPDETITIYGLVVHPDRDVRKDHVRVCTKNLPDKALFEYRQAKADFAEAVAASV